MADNSDDVDPLAGPSGPTVARSAPRPAGTSPLSGSQSAPSTVRRPLSSWADESAWKSSFRSQQADEDRTRRMTSWGVFGAIFPDGEAFEGAMGSTSSKGKRKGKDRSRPSSRAPSIASVDDQVTDDGASGHQRMNSRSGLLSGRMTAEPGSYLSVPTEPPIEEASSEDDSDSESESDEDRTLQDGRVGIKTRPASYLAQNAKGAWSAWPSWRSLWQCIRAFRLKAHQRTVLKCSIAYFIASLFTFCDPLSRLLSDPFNLDGPFSGAHTLATIVAYYRPAPTPGAMMQANMYAVVGLLWSAFLVLGSMATAVSLNNQSYETLSHVIIIVVWIGGGYGLIAFAKQKISNPAFSTTCSMICVISSVIITREGAVHYGYFETTKLKLYSFLAILGVAISNLVCLLLWRGSATNKLQGDINKTLDSFATLFTVLVKTFLLDESIYLNEDRLKRSIDDHNSSFTALKKSLESATFEFLEPRIRRSREEYDEIVASMTRLAQHLTGLRSGCGLQSELIQAARKRSYMPEEVGEQDEEEQRLRPARIIFESFRDHIGDSLKSLMSKSNKTLRRLRKSFLQPHEKHDDLDAELGLGADAINALQPDLVRALQDFEVVHSDEMKRLYREAPSQAELPPGGVGEYANTLDSSKANEEIFLIYFFLFSLEEFVRELCHLVDSFALLRQEEEIIAEENQKRTVWWKYFGSPCSYRPRRKDPRPPEKRKTLAQRLGTIFPVDPRGDQDIAYLLSDGSQGHQNRHHDGSWYVKLKRTTYDLGRSFEQPDVRFAVKVGIGAALLATPAFIHASRPIFNEFKGQWAIVSYMVVMSSTVGQTNFLALLRFLGTLLGAGVAVGVYHLFWEDPVTLPIIGFFFSIPCFWIMVTRPALASTGRFILLSYNLTCLYSYNVREDEVHIMKVALHRVVAVLVGVLWGWIITNLVWPYKARRELRAELSAFLLGCAFLYSHLVKQYSTPPDELGECNPDDTDLRPHVRSVNSVRELNGDALAGNGESTALLTPSAKHHLDSSVRDFLNMELFLQIRLINMTNLLAATKHEPRLKGPFPVETYRSFLASAQTVLDMFHSMRSITTRPRWYTTVRRDFVLPVQKQRKEMVGNVLLFFSVLATSVELKAPLPPWLPPAGRARERLIEKIRQLPVVKRRLVKGRSDYLLYFAYSIAMKTVVQHLETMGERAQDLYGVIGGVESAAEFERLFESPEEQQLEALKPSHPPNGGALDPAD